MTLSNGPLESVTRRLISASLLVRSRYRKMPILASLNAEKKIRSKSPFSIGLVFSIVSESTVERGRVDRILIAPLLSAAGAKPAAC